MKNLSCVLALAALLTAASASAGEGSFGENHFHGSDMASYAAKPQAPASRPQAAARQEAGQAKQAMVWGDRAVDPIYFNLTSQAQAGARQGSGPAGPVAGETDFILAYAR